MGLLRPFSKTIYSIIYSSTRRLKPLSPKSDSWFKEINKFGGEGGNRPGR